MNAMSLLRYTERPLAEEYDVALLDLDGVVYIGPDVVRHAGSSLAQARAVGMRLAFVTNNASRTPESIAIHLTRIGVAAEPDEVVTSAQAAARVVAELVPAGSPILMVGAEGLEHALLEQGLVPVTTLDDHPRAVVQGYGPDVGWRQLAEASFAVQRSLPWVACNTDPTLPTPRGQAPGNGALVQVVRIATGREPVVAGKPEPPMHREAMLRTGAERPLVVGDRLDTDIEGAHRGGVDSLLVLTGVTLPHQVVLAPAGMRPTFVGRDLRSLLDRQPRLAVDVPDARIDGWHASAHDGRLHLVRTASDSASEGDDGIGALRVACAAAWAADPGTLDPRQVRDEVEAAMHAGAST